MPGTQTYPGDFFAWMTVVFPPRLFKFDQVVELLVHIIDLVTKARVRPINTTSKLLR